MLFQFDLLKPALRIRGKSVGKSGSRHKWVNKAFEANEDIFLNFHNVTAGPESREPETNSAPGFLNYRADQKRPGSAKLLVSSVNSFSVVIKLYDSSG